MNFNINMMSLENISDRASQYIPRNVHKNIHLEEIKVKNHRLVKINPHGLEGNLPPRRMIRASKGLKRVDFSVGAKTSWYFREKILLNEKKKVFNKPRIEFAISFRNEKCQ